MPTKVTERSINLRAHEVRAILDGRQSQLRRIIKPQPCIDSCGNFCWNGGNYGQSTDRTPCSQAIASSIPWSHTKRVANPFGPVGGRLWVRETWAPEQYDADGLTPEQLAASTRAPAYQADFSGNPAYKWRPSIHMPRWASRLTLEIVSVRCERLQEISPEDVLAEGVGACLDCDSHNWMHRDGIPHGHASDYEELWQSINGPGSWADNPWTWIVEFRMVPK